MVIAINMNITPMNDSAAMMTAKMNMTVMPALRFLCCFLALMPSTMNRTTDSTMKPSTRSDKPAPTDVTSVSYNEFI